MTAPTVRPWKVVELDGSLWIEGAPGSAATDPFPADRRVVCDFAFYGDASLDAETRANADLVVERVNAEEVS